MNELIPFFSPPLPAVEVEVEEEAEDRKELDEREVDVEGDVTVVDEFEMFDCLDTLLTEVNVEVADVSSEECAAGPSSLLPPLELPLLFRVVCGSEEGGFVDGCCCTAGGGRDFLKNRTIWCDRFRPITQWPIDTGCKIGEPGQKYPVEWHYS